MRVLLVDHDSEGLDTIARAIRGVLELDCVTSKGDALLLLRQNQYDVLIACERAVDGSGLDLLGRTTRTAVPLKRIFAAAPDRLQLLGPRLAPFKVQRTINYPIDLEELWLAIAQVTGTNDETDGTIERVVLDERGIPSNGTTPRSPIPPRPPAPLGGLRAAPTPSPAPAPAPVPAPAIAASANGAARTAAARVAQPVPEPPLRAPPPPRQPPPVMRQAAGAAQMRAQAPAMQPIPPMPMPAAAPIPAPRSPVNDWTPEVRDEDDFAQVAAQARLGVQRKAVDEVARRKKQRLLTACGVAVAVAGVIVLLIEKFYDPEARAREKAIAAEVTRMAEQQKVTDDLTLIEVDIEKAIMNNELDAARAELASLVSKSPNHPRREFLQKSIDRAAELQKLAGQSPAQAQVLSTPASADRKSAPHPKPVERGGERTEARTPTRAPDRSVAAMPDRPGSGSRTPKDVPPVSRNYGAPLGEPPRQATIRLDAPINSPPTMTTQRTDNFPGRTVEASDSAVGRGTTSFQSPGSSNSSGSAAVAMPPAAAPAQAPPAAVDVVPAKIVKRVTPVVGSEVSSKAAGYVIVKFDIGTNGRVTNVVVVESTPAGVFDESATTAVRKWIYEPRKENGVAVSSQSKAKLVFDAAN